MSLSISRIQRCGAEWNVSTFALDYNFPNQLQFVPFNVDTRSQVCGFPLRDSTEVPLIHGNLILTNQTIADDICSSIIAHLVLLLPSKFNPIKPEFSCKEIILLLCYSLRHFSNSYWVNKMSEQAELLCRCHDKIRKHVIEFINQLSSKSN